MELLAEARDALQVRDEIRVPPFQPRPERPADGTKFVHQTSLALLRDALMSTSPFDAEGTFAAIKESHSAALGEVSNGRAMIEGQRRQILSLSESVSRTNGAAATLRNKLSSQVDEFAKVSRQPSVTNDERWLFQQISLLIAGTL